MMTKITILSTKDIYSYKRQFIKIKMIAEKYKEVTRIQSQQLLATDCY